MLLSKTYAGSSQLWANPEPTSATATTETMTLIFLNLDRSRLRIQILEEKRLHNFILLASIVFNGTVHVTMQGPSQLPRFHFVDNLLAAQYTPPR